MIALILMIALFIGAVVWTVKTDCEGCMFFVLPPMFVLLVVSSLFGNVGGEIPMVREEVMAESLKTEYVGKHGTPTYTWTTVDEAGRMQSYSTAVHKDLAIITYDLDSGKKPYCVVKEHTWESNTLYNLFDIKSVFCERTPEIDGYEIHLPKV